MYCLRAAGLAAWSLWSLILRRMIHLGRGRGRGRGYILVFPPNEWSCCWYVRQLGGVPVSPLSLPVPFRSAAMLAFPFRCHAGESVDSLLLSRDSMSYAVSVVRQCKGRAGSLALF
ncbi:hypothetical protein LY76DRAFT_424317 [Colletotrichum caudatum]|nr:hypothetical protein LY76DRAFT_424317 [Colletotrichum caudatum]